MQHIRTPVLYFEGHDTLWRAVKYISLTLAGLIAIFEHSPAFLIVLLIAYVLVLALIERARKRDTASSLPPYASASRFLGDGGSFPGAVPEEEGADSRPASVLDGGSLEHHRS
jgi:hypothetical protein